MKKIIITPINDVQLAQWITTLDGANVDYKQVLNSAGKPGILLDETDAEVYLGMRKLNTTEDRLKSFFSRFLESGSTSPKQKKGCMPSWGTILGGALLIFILMRLGECEGNSDPYESTPEPVKTMTFQDSIDAQFSAWDGSHRGMEKAIKAQMKNPDSYEHVETGYKIIGKENENGVKALYIVTTFRGTNSFNAVVTQQAKGTFSMDGQQLTFVIE